MLCPGEGDWIDEKAGVGVDVVDLDGVVSVESGNTLGGCEGLSRHESSMSIGACSGEGEGGGEGFECADTTRCASIDVSARSSPVSCISEEDSRPGC